MLEPGWHIFFSLADGQFYKGMASELSILKIHSQSRRRHRAGANGNDAAREERRAKDETLRRRDLAEWLVHPWRQHGGQMRERHPDKHRSARGVEFDRSFHSVEMASSSLMSATGKLVRSAPGD
jgi:hypothetical protein